MLERLNALSPGQAGTAGLFRAIDELLECVTDLGEFVADSQGQLVKSGDIGPLFSGIEEYPATAIDKLHQLGSSCTKLAALLQFLASPSRRLLGEFLADGSVEPSTVAETVENMPRYPYEAYAIVHADLARKFSEGLLSDDRDQRWALAAVCVEHGDMTELEAAEQAELPPSQVAAAVEWYRKLPLVERAGIELVLRPELEGILGEKEVYLGHG